MADGRYPAIEPYQTAFLSVSAGHEIYYEEVGNPLGKPILFLHGGPGGSVLPKSRTYFDPAFYRIILFDQRGTGKSRPHLSLIDNTTWHLVADIESLRTHLNITKWVVFGGSWGSTLALTYAVTHPEQVIGLILRGVFLGRKIELDWLYQHGASMIHPAEWQSFIAPIPQAEQADILSAYYKRLTTITDQSVIFSLAKRWNDWETANAYHIKPENGSKEQQISEQAQRDANLSALAIALIESHYFVNHCFYNNENEILDRIDAIQSIPCRIVQGQYDTVCPVQTAWDLKQKYPQAELTIVPDGGHAGSVGNMAVALVGATEAFKDLYSK